MKSYCTEKRESCEGCPLLSFGKDCRNSPIGNKQEQIHFRTTLDIRNKMLALAAAENRSISSYLESLILRDAENKKL